MASNMVSLFSLANWKNGLAFKQINFSEKGKPVIKIAELKNGITAQTARTQQEFDSDVHLTKGDMVFSWSGNPETSIDVFWYDLPDGWLNQHIFKVTPNNGVDKLYLYYLLKFLKPQFTAIASNKQTTGLGHVTVKDMKEMMVPLPEMAVQQAIGAYLHAIDQKAYVNNKINDNLQQQARALFFEWFIKTPQNCAAHETELGLLPADYSVIKTGELPMIVTDYVANGSFASLKENVQLYQERNYAYFIRNTDLKAGTFEVFVDEHSYNFLAKSRLFGGEIIISNVGDVGSVFLCPKLDAPMTLGNNIIMLKPSQDELRYYLYIWFKWSMGQGLMQGIKGGSAQPKFNKTDFKSLPVILPPQDILHRFHETVRPMFEAIDGNQAENRRLAALRDTILPKLMSGEIDVSDIII